MKGSIDKDAQFLEMLEGLKVSEPKIFCPAGNKISRMCTNPACNTSLHCNSLNCEHCGTNAHPSCLSVTTIGITSMLN